MTAGALGALAQRALKWSALTTVARFALQFVAQVALARLLGPGNFGVYGIGMVVLTFVGFLSGASFSYSLMLAPRVNEEDIRFAFTWQMIAGILAAAAMYAAAAPLAVFFGDARVEGMVQLLSLASLLIAATAPSTYLLQRDLDFRTLGLIQLASYAAGYLLVGVPLALAGFGAWALGMACVVQAAVALGATYRAKPHPLRPLWRHADGSDALVTGRNVFLTNVVNWLLGNLDRVIIGRALDAHAVGLYTLAYNLASIPNALVLGALQPTFLATGARLQDEGSRLARGWLLAVACILVLGTPAAVVLALLSHDIVQLLYGQAWVESAWVLGLMFLCLPAWAAWGLSTPVLWNTNRKQYEFLLQLPLLAVAVPAWWLLAPSGIRSVAWVSAGVILARAVIIIAAALRALGLRGRTILGYLVRGLGLSALCVLAALGGLHAVAGLASPLAALIAGGAGAALVMLLVLLLRPSALGHEALAAMAQLSPRVSARIARSAAMTDSRGTVA